MPITDPLCSAVLHSFAFHMHWPFSILILQLIVALLVLQRYLDAQQIQLQQTCPTAAIIPCPAVRKRATRQLGINPSATSWAWRLGLLDATPITHSLLLLN